MPIPLSPLGHDWYRRQMDERMRWAEEERKRREAEARRQAEERRRFNNMAYGVIAPHPGGFAKPFRPII